MPFFRKKPVMIEAVQFRDPWPLDKVQRMFAASRAASPASAPRETPEDGRSRSTEYPLPPGTCASGAHPAGTCQCSGIPNLHATIDLLEMNLRAARQDDGRWRSALLALGKCPACKSGFRDACAPEPAAKGCPICAPARILLAEAEAAPALPEAPASETGRCIGCRIESEIGTEERPHPVPKRFHSCVSQEKKTS